MTPIEAGALGSLGAGLMTGVGALPVLALRRISPGLQNAMLAFAAGVMLAASFFSLIIPALAASEAGGASGVEAAAIVTGAVLLGAAFLAWMERRVQPIDRFIWAPAGGDAKHLRRIWLFVGAITVHNFPEGLAVGVSFGSGDFGLGLATAIGIGTQNMPEGLAVAAALAGAGYSRGRAALIALASGLVEPLMGLLGAVAVSLAAPLLPWALGFAAGAMLTVVVTEIIPATHCSPRPMGTPALMIGLALMMFLDVTLG